MSVAFGLSEVAGSASLTLVFFPAVVLLSVLGLRFGYYARLNRTHTGLGAGTAIWNHLVYVGLLAAAYGGVVILEIVSTIRVPGKSGFVLALVLVLAFAIREIHRATGEGTDPSGPERMGRGIFVALVFVYMIGAIAGGPPRLLAGLEGIAAFAFLVYGATFYGESTASARLQGTVIDSLVRHLLPVLVFASLVNVTNLAFALGVDRQVVPHIQVVFVIMTATALMTATIKLRQNLAGL